ncbi:hypothetical protein N7519_002477 [Penicillium mononematosum]|uniref:uncharacterized protein n=1 Tax=Penicillium mononematosum TaxID=268346 RepID=UPI0025479E8F|nr:uncharacterized protein N7519_002477 [Penicillium mononematosum]KAJ6187569.1 hypothetical protein N7519_002477 [Penicillium mononematosum]
MYKVIFESAEKLQCISITMSEKKRILVLGSGMVAPPCIEYLTRSPQNEVAVGETIPSLSSCAPMRLIQNCCLACRTLSSAQRESYLLI